MVSSLFSLDFLFLSYLWSFFLILYYLLQFVGYWSNNMTTVNGSWQFHYFQWYECNHRQCSKEPSSCQVCVADECVDMFLYCKSVTVHICLILSLSFLFCFSPLNLNMKLFIPDKYISIMFSFVCFNKSFNTTGPLCVLYHYREVIKYVLCLPHHFIFCIPCTWAVTGHMQE